MGLHIKHLQSIPESVDLDYFIYLLDYGWDETLQNTLNDNFVRMAQKSEPQKAVTIRGTDIGHFSGEVLSWHQINGQDADEILPAVMIANKHPIYFRDNFSDSQWRGAYLRENSDGEGKIVLLPLRKFCKSSTDVIDFIQNIFRDIESRKELHDFNVVKEVKKGVGHAVWDALILQPNFSGLGVDIKRFFTK